MKIYLITAHPVLNEEQINKLKKLGDFTVIDAQRLKAQDVIARANDAEIIIAGSSGIETISGELLVGLKRLKFISLLTVGTDWVDLKSARDLNISMSIVKGSNAEAVAEHAWSMILDLSKKVTEADRDVRNNGEYKFGPYLGKEVYGKVLGIIGLGDIGIKVANIARVFHMKVFGVNKTGKLINGVELTSLNELLSSSDIVTIHVPLTKETENLIGEKEFEQIKNGAILVNTAREKIVNKQALFETLKSGKLFGYGIDTEIMQPIDKEYLSYSNVIVTPHIAFNTEEARKNSYDMAIENIAQFLKGTPQNIVK